MSYSKWKMKTGKRLKVPGKTYTRKMTYVDIPFLAHLAFGRERVCSSLFMQVLKSVF